VSANGLGSIGMADPVAWYDANAENVSARYEEAAAGDLYGWLLDLLPATPAATLDVGAGSGRDAAWLANKGYDVVAVEPSARMRDAAARFNPESRVRWINDSLPALSPILIGMFDAVRPTRRIKGDP
jgi:SAM-dependent methyltransferase